MFGLALLFVCVFLLSFEHLGHLAGEEGLVFVLTVDLFVSYAHVNLCHFFSSSWCQGLAATSACGSSWTFLFTFLQALCVFNSQSKDKIKSGSFRPLATLKSAVSRH